MDVKDLDAATARQWLDEGRAELVDIRDAGERRRLRVPAARWMPLAGLDAGLKAEPRGAVGIFHCQSGRRTRQHADRLAAVGSAETYVLAGGIQAWRRAGGPVTSDSGAIDIMRQVQIVAGGLIVAIPLAIGRASSLKAISWTCTAYIELVRGAPLLGWLFVALFILEDVIGGSLLVRTMVVLAVFTGAYMAEYIRGGLQALPQGQDEAARAVGLSRRQTLQQIIMPQALRVSIPPLVGQAISIWKDTSLVSVILPMRELKGNADSAIAQTAFLADRIEVYVFVAVIFWIVAFTMSRISQRVERAQGVGER